MELVSPIARKGVDQSRLPHKPCGGTLAGAVHFETTPGSRNMFGWKVIHPSHTGNCTLRVGDKPDEKYMRMLLPVDGSANEDGAFPCGR